MGRGMDIAVCTVSQCFFGVSFLQSCVEYPFRVCHFPYLHISLSMKRRRLVEPCGADAASVGPHRPRRPCQRHRGKLCRMRATSSSMCLHAAQMRGWCIASCRYARPPSKFGTTCRRTTGRCGGASYIDVPSRYRGGHSHWLVKEETPLHNGQEDAPRANEDAALAEDRLWRGAAPSVHRRQGRVQRRRQNDVAHPHGGERTHKRGWLRRARRNECTKARARHRFA